MSGHDALDELYERLRETEDARRAGEITPEAIRAARGGAVDGYGRECHVAGENAAGGDSAPLAGDSRDSRERIEADLLALTESWRDHDGDFMKIYSSVAYAQVKELLDRQAALTERETKLRELYRFEENHREHVRSIEEVNQRLNERIAELQAEVDELSADNDHLQGRMLGLEDDIISLEAERDELQAKLDEYDQTHMLLPLDADGVPIRLGDVMDGVGMYDTLRDVTGEVIEVSFNATDDNESVASVALQVWLEDGKSWRRVYIDQYADVYRHHVEPKRTVEDVLTDFAAALERDASNSRGVADNVARYAAELRELMANDGLAPENGVSARGWRSNDGEEAL